MSKTFLKRLIVFSTVLLLVFGSLSGCGNNSEAGSSNSKGKSTNTYTPPVNEDGYIVITIPKTLLGSYTAEELEAADKAGRAKIDNEEQLKMVLWSALLANEDGTFSYYLTQDQYTRLKALYYWLGCLRNPYTAEISEDFVTEAEYTDFDENGIPWGLVVSVDADTYYSMQAWYSAMVTVKPAIFLGRYQVLRGIPGDKWSIHVTVKDKETGEIILENDFPTRDE